jgi:hypothetical protein
MGKWSKAAREKQSARMKERFKVKRELNIKREVGTSSSSPIKANTNGVTLTEEIDETINRLYQLKNRLHAMVGK